MPPRKRGEGRGQGEVACEMVCPSAMFHPSPLPACPSFAQCTCLVTCVATIAEELSGFVGDDEAAAASGGASPHPLAPPRLCEHWDDVFDDVDAEAAAIASEVCYWSRAVC